MYSGKKLGITIGAKTIPKIVITTESIIVYFFIFFVSFPAESRGKINLNTIDENINITEINCNARE